MNQTEKMAQQRSERRSAERGKNHLGRRLRQAEMLLTTYRSLTAQESLDRTLNALIEIMAAECGAEWGTIFLNDSRTGELYSRVMHGELAREIRILNSEGIAGHVFQTGKPLVIEDAYESKYFNPGIDATTGLKTRSILAIPIRKTNGDLMGVCEMVNKKTGAFTEENQEVVEALATHASISLDSAQYAERMELSRQQKMEFLDIVADVTSEIDLSTVLRKVMAEATRLLNAERSTLFLNNEKTAELWSEVGQGLDTAEIRIPNTAGIAGAVFTSGETINIPHAYADLRFNPSVDQKTGYFTRSILCVPVINKEGKTIGVTQVLNKFGGVFTQEDESRLKAFSAQVSIGLENAQLFHDVQNMKNYNESMLESMSNGVVTLDQEGRVVTCNQAVPGILQQPVESLIGREASEIFAGNDWVLERIARVNENNETDITMDAELELGDTKVSLNLSVLPLRDAEQANMGMMLMMEDITSEKRIKSTMSRYMDPVIADQVLSSGQDVLGGQNLEATILFSDLRGFTTLSERLGATGIVSLLNEYFTLMVECIQKEDGMLDKFIGDAIMAAFGVPLTHDDDADRAMRSAIAMIRTLQKWNADNSAMGAEQLDMGIGLNTDIVVCGNIGSPRRMDFTIIGDGVNLASRLESACKQYNARILISDNTRQRLKGTYRMREADRVVVKGKTEPVSVFEVLDYHSAESFPNLMEAVGHFQEGQDHYRAAAWDKATRAFEVAASLNPTDKLPALYLQRCAHLAAEPPGKDWKGVWVMKTK